MIAFTKGQQLTARFIGDFENTLKAVVINRTAKFVTLKIEGDDEEKRVSVTEYEGVEQCFPLGKYSRAVRFRADKPNSPKDGTATHQPTNGTIN